MIDLKKITSVLIVCMVWTFFIAQTMAGELRFVLEDEPIYTSSSKTSPGFLMEVVSEMTKILKIKPKIEFHPWGKAQELAIKTPNTMIFPLTRTTVREPKYSWVVKIFDVPVAFITKQGSPMVNTIVEAVQLKRIGTIESTPQHHKLKELGFRNIVAMPSAKLQSVLKTNKVDAVYTAIPEIAYAWGKAGFSEKLQFGLKLQTLPLWLATSKKSDQVNVEEWIQAFDVVQQEGLFDELFDKYFGG